MIVQLHHHAAVRLVRFRGTGDGVDADGVVVFLDVDDEGVSHQATALILRSRISFASL
jgi:hypothetical protein